MSFNFFVIGQEVIYGDTLYSRQRKYERITTLLLVNVQIYIFFYTVVD
jgi:hypothetical protein